ncbi:MAG: peptidoglycan-binding domain-containing protein [Candidatus Paceibacterota bacterium]|jgi:peptidoglycan hydrolase-like protein with peptidoglycan-binding domain
MSKKLIAIALAGVFALSIVAPVKAVTIEELQAQIAVLLAQITALSGSQATGTVCFNTDLSQGMTANDVKNLQIVLNKNSSTRVALSGAGSSGNETTYFGSLTFAAVKNFQASKSIINTGYVGPLTRAALNALYCVALPTTTTTTTLAPVTGLPAGCTSTAGFSPTTGVACSSTVTAAVEGALTVTQYPIPASNTVIVYGGDVNREITAYKIRATNSDIRVKRFLLQFAIAADFPWRDLSTISIWDGTTLLKEVAVNATNFSETTFATTYTMTLDGLDVLVAKDTEKVLSIKASALAVPQYIGAMTVLIPANGVRGVDTTGLNIYGPAGALAAVNFTTAAAQAPTVTVTAATDNPLAGNFIGSLTAVTRVDLMKLNVKAEGVAMTFKGGRINVITNTGNTAMSTVELYDGATLLSATATTTAAPAAHDLTTYTLVVPAGTTKVLTFKAVVPANTTAADQISIDLPATTGLTGVDANGTARNNGATGGVTGAILTHYLVAPTFALNSASVLRSNSTSGTVNDVGDFSIGVKVTANGGDIFLPTAAHTTHGAGLAAEGFLNNIVDGAGTVGATSSYWACDSVAIEDATAGNLVWRIPSGATSVCTVNLHAINTTAAGYYDVSIGAIIWGDTVTDLNVGTDIVQATGLTALKAPATNLGI